MAKARAKATREVNGRPVRNVAIYEDAYNKLVEMQSRRGVMLTHAVSELIEWVLELGPDLSASIIAGQTKPSWVAVARELARRQGMEFPEPSATELPPDPGPDHLNITRHYRDPDGPKDSGTRENNVIGILRDGRVVTADDLSPAAPPPGVHVRLEHRAATHQQPALPPPAPPTDDKPKRRK